MSTLRAFFFAVFARWVGPVAKARLATVQAAASASAPTRLMGFDQALVWVTLGLLAWGLVMVYLRRLFRWLGPTGS